MLMLDFRLQLPFSPVNSLRLSKLFNARLNESRNKKLAAISKINQLSVDQASSIILVWHDSGFQ